MSNTLKRPALPWIALLTLVGGLAAAAGCGGEGAKKFGGEETGGAHGATGGNLGSGSGGNIASGTGGATATGGMSATGAAPGSGGDRATGGVTGGGGAPGTGGAGATGTGGRSATGGMSGTGATGSGASGGHGGTGATIGTGGTGASGSGGRPGTGGAPGTGGSSAMCDSIAADYQAEMPNARACNTLTGLTVPQCQTMAPGSLGCGGGCIVYVQDNAKLAEIQKRWNAMNCQSIPRLCPAISCIDAKPGYCYASTGSVTAQCQAGPKT